VTVTWYFNINNKVNFYPNYGMKRNKYSTYFYTTSIQLFYYKFISLLLFCYSLHACTSFLHLYDVLASPWWPVTDLCRKPVTAQSQHKTQQSTT